MSRSILKKNRGIALVTTIILLALLVVFGFAAWKYYSGDISFSSNYRYTREALYLAEAGIQEAIKRLALPTSDVTVVTSIFGSGSPSQKTSSAQIGEELQTSSFPTPQNANWITRIFPQGATFSTPASGETHTQSFQPSAGALAYTSSSKPILVAYKLEDATHNKGGANGEVVLYGQDFGYGSDAPAIGTQPVYVITATGKAGNGVEKTVRVETSRKKLHVDLQGALSSGLNVKATGTCFLDGTNHNKELDLNWGTGPGEYKDPSDDHLLLSPSVRIYNDKISNGSPTSAWASEASTTSKKAIVTTPGKTIGFKSPTATRGEYTWGLSGAAAVQEGGILSIPSFKDFLGISDQEYQTLLASADVNLSMLNNGAAPKGFTYINNPGATFMFNSSVPDPIGYVLMYVTGDLKITSNVKFKGVIFVEGDLSITGAPTIMGGIMARGETDTTFSAGNINILYSSGVVQDLNDTLGPFKILDWREIKR